MSAEQSIDDMVTAGVAAYKAMSPVEQALHDDAQRRSFVRGQSGRDPGAGVLADEVRQLRTENETLKVDVIAFCALWATQYAQGHGWPSGHLHPVHYDVLERCGARMADFTRANVPTPSPGEREL